MVVLSSILAVLVPVPASAQVDLTGYVGAYIPTADLVDEEAFGVVLDQKTSLAFGARANLGSGLVGLEGTFLYAPGDADRGGTTGELSSNVWAASARLALKLGLPAFPIAVHGTAGPFIVGHTGDAFEGTDDSTDFGGVVGLGAQLGTPPVKIRADAEAYIYSFEGEDPLGVDTFQSQTQADLVFSIGLMVGL